MRPVAPEDQEKASRDVTVWSRAQFLDYFRRNYAPGQHVTLIGPTQRGKTRISHEMLGEVISPKLPALILAGKPPGRDSTMDRAPDALGLEVTQTWPPPASVRAKGWFRRKVAESPTNGYVLKPRHTLTDLDADKENLRRQFRAGMMHAYAGKMGEIIVVVDETKLIYDLKLQEQHEAILTRGAPVVSIWSLLQRGRYVSYYAYDMPEHILFFQDEDLPNVRRYAEMVGGVDPSLIKDAMGTLQSRTNPLNGMTNSECLYYRRSGSHLAIVKLD